MTKKILNIKDLSFSYKDKIILNKINFSLEENQKICILGPSGSGKSTLLNCIAGFLTPSFGTIELYGQILSKDGKNRVAIEDRDIGFVFQDYCLFPHLNAFKNISFGLGKLKKKEIKDRVMEVAELTNISDKLKKFPHELSGGEQQRVALSRALAPKPKVLLLDEAFSNMDYDLKVYLINELNKILENQKLPAIMITHDKEEADSFGDKIITLS